jgi:hypothetical protein
MIISHQKTIEELTKLKVPDKDSALDDAQVVSWTQGYNDGIQKAIEYIQRIGVLR